MGWLGPARDGVGQPESARIHRQLAAVRRTGRSAAGKPGIADFQRDLGQWLPDLGLAYPVPVQLRSDLRRPLYPTGDRRNTRVPATGRTTPDRIAARGQSHPEEPERDPAFGVRAHGGAGSVLRLYQLHFRL